MSVKLTQKIIKENGKFSVAFVVIQAKENIYKSSKFLFLDRENKIR